MSLWQNISTPPAPPLKAHTSPLANMFTQENNTFSATNSNKGIMASNMAFSFGTSLCALVLFKAELSVLS